MGQTAIASIQPTGAAGMWGDVSPANVAASVHSNEVSAPIPPGYAVVVDSANTSADADDGVILPSANTQLLKGIALFDHSFARTVQIDDATGGYLPDITFDVARKGRVRVVAQGTMLATDHVHVQVVTNGGALAGTFRASADAGKSYDCSDFMKVVEHGDATTPPLVEIDLTMASLAIQD